jgi:O-glycosyl hydrolase
MKVKKTYIHIMAYLFIFFSLFAFAQCRRSSSVLPPASDSTCFYNGIDTCSQKQGKLVLTINLNEVYQTIHSFGASDGWTAKFAGNWTDVSKKNKMADLLFSMDTLPDGSPQGIGLSLWRFNIGAGSDEQGDSSDIGSDWNTAQCFLNADGTYDWNKEEGHQWFLQAARQRGVKYIVGFAISPPVYYTKNGKAFSPGGDSLNIKQGDLNAYADFLVRVADHFHFDYISPVNEPQWGWTAAANGIAKQEGSPARNSEIAALVKLLSGKLAAVHSPSQVVIGEAGEWSFLYGNNSDGRGNQIQDFFSPSSDDYIGNLPNVLAAISSHSYFTTCPDATLINVRQQVSDRIKQVDPSLQTWMSEFCVLGNICNQYNGSPRNTGIDYGLYVAKVMDNDLTIANVSSWQWWRGISPADYNDGLVYINDPSGQINPGNCEQDGIVLGSKELWVMGNFSRFVRPGMQRVDAVIQGYEDPVAAASSLMVSAYKNVSTKELVIVIINMTSQPKILQLNTEGGFKMGNNLLNAYTTNAASNLKRSYVPDDSIAVGPSSVITLTGTYQ